MGRIKNYSACHDDAENAVYYWEHTESNLSVEVRESRIKYIAYVVVDGEDRQLLPLRNEADEARKIAVTWMRQNPTPTFET